MCWADRNSSMDTVDRDADVLLVFTFVEESGCLPGYFLSGKERVLGFPVDFLA